jgi:phosphonate transport system substrate-binding protein
MQNIKMGKEDNQVNTNFLNKMALGVIALSMNLISSSAPAWADWRKDMGTFRVGLSASDSKALSQAELDILRLGFSKALSMPVDITIMRDYPALIDAQVSGRIEYAIYSASAYAAAWLLCECVEPLVAPVQTNGATGIRSVLVMNANATFTRMDLNGIRVGIPGKDSVSGFATPMAEYLVGSRALNKTESFLKHYPDMETTLSALSKGEVDGFFGWVSSDDKAAIASAGLMDHGTAQAITVQGVTTEIKLPWISSLHKFGPHAVRRNLPSEAKQTLIQFLLSLDEAMIDLVSRFPPGNVEKLAKVSQDMYLPSIRAAKAMAE